MPIQDSTQAQRPSNQADVMPKGENPFAKFAQQNQKNMAFGQSTQY